MFASATALVRDSGALDRIRSATLAVLVRHAFPHVQRFDVDGRLLANEASVERHLADSILFSRAQCRRSAKRNVMPTSNPKRIQPAPRTMPNQANIFPFSVPSFFFISLSAKIPVISATATQRFRTGIIIPFMMLMILPAASCELYNTKMRPILMRAISPLAKLTIARRFVFIELSIDFFPKQIFRSELVSMDGIMLLMLQPVQL